MVKIIHFHVQTKSNIGDAAIVFSIKDLLNSNFKITKYTSKEISNLKKDNYPMIIGTIKKYSRVYKFIPIGKLLDKIFKKIKNRLDNRLLRIINGHDLMVIGGGGIYSKWFFPLKNNLIKKIKIPLVIFGAGYIRNFGDKNLSKQQIGSIIILNKKAKLSSVRGLESQKFLKQLGFNAHYIGDPAIFLKGKKTSVRFKKNIRIGINIAYHGWKLQDKYIEKILVYYTRLLKELDRKYNPQFFYLKHHPYENKIIKKIKKEFPNITICNYGPYQMKSIYENLDLVIGMMLHSLILAFGSSVPVFNIAYSNKDYEFMSSINQEDNIIDVRRLNLRKIDDLVNKIPNLIKKENDFIRIKKDFERKTNNFIKKMKLLT